MKVGFDITVLYRATAGVYYYRYRLLEALLALNDPALDFTFFNYRPLQIHKEEPPAIHMLKNAHVPIKHIRGVKHRKLQHLFFLQNPLTEPAAKWIDQVANERWQQLTQSSKETQLQKNLADVQILHTSDVLQHALPHARTVTNIHDLTTLLFPQHHLTATQALHNQKFTFAREKADAIIALSHHTKKDIMRELGIPAEKIYVVHGGVDVSFRPLPPVDIAAPLKQVGLTPDGYILHVGTIEPRKNLIRLIDAHEQLCQADPSAPPLVLVGRKGWGHESVYEHVAKRGRETAVKFLHNITDALLPVLYNGACFFVYPSLYEGFGLPPLEAMACETAVITSNTSSLPEVVGDAGLMVNPEDTDALAHAMITLYQNRERRAELATKGKQQASQFSWRHVAQQTINVYKKVTADQ